MAKEKHPSKVDDKLLSAIYQDESGQVPDLNTIERRRFPRGMAIAVGLVLFVSFLAGSAWAGFGLLQPFGHGNGIGLGLNIRGPERISLGQETTYFINWQNVSDGPLSDADVRISFPPEFNPTGIEPHPSEDGSMHWDLGPVSAGARGTFTIRGIFTGALGKETAVQAVGTYRAQGKADHEALATMAVTYADTVVQGRMDLPPKALSGDKVKAAYIVQNTGLVPLEGLEMRLTMPKGFIPDAGITGEDGMVRLPIGTLTAGSTSSLAVSGMFAAGVIGDVAWHAELGRGAADGSFQPVQVTDANMAVLGGDLSLKLVANGSDADRSIGYGDLVRFTLGYQNTAAEDLRDVVLRLRFEPITASTSTASSMTASPNGPFADWDKADMSPNGSTSSLPTIVWDKSAITLLERLPPQQDGSVDLAVPTVGMASGSAAGFQVTVEASIAGVGSTAFVRTVRTAPMRFVFRSDADVISEARYFSEEGVQLGSGPLPPTVGQSTTYHVIWDVSKHAHELKDMTVSAVLPKNVAWPNITTSTAGEVAYDEASRKISWTLNRMPEGVDDAVAEFDVSFTPDGFDAGRFADLLGETRLEATDADVNEPIVRAKPGLSTDLKTDEGAKNKGVVRKP